MDRELYDLTILGGGLGGLSLALQVRDRLPDARIKVLEKRLHPAPEAAFKVGESTVEVAAHYFGHVLGLRQHILDDQLPKLGLRFFFPFGDNSRIEDRLELGGKRYAPCPSYQLDRGRFENYLADRCLAERIEFVDGAEIQEIELGSRRKQHRVEYRIDSRNETVESRWVVDASGRRSFLKRLLGLAKPSPHVANAVWFRFDKHIRVDDWSSDSAWQAGHAGKTGRWFSTNHLMGKGYWVWLIPLASGSTSMGIVAAEQFHPLSNINSMEKALHWLEEHEPQCASAVRSNLDRLQDFRAIKHYAVECKQVFSGQRWGITGEAGFFHDPFYSPGSDFIALANTFLTDLIDRSLTGREYRIRAYAYDRLFKKFYYGTSRAYQDQYCLFGNPTVMPIKILWDYLVYWSITGFIFMQGRLCQPAMYMRNFAKLSKLGKLNHFMQDFFRTWHHHTDGETFGGTIDISKIPLIRETNRRLLEETNNGEYVRRFSENLAQLETLSCEIVRISGIDATPPCQPSRSGIRTQAFESVFAELTARRHSAPPSKLEGLAGPTRRPTPHVPSTRPASSR